MRSDVVINSHLNYLELARCDDLVLDARDAAQLGGLQLFGQDLGNASLRVFRHKWDRNEKIFASMTIVRHRNRNFYFGEE